MGNDALRSLQISTPVEFSVRVPVKNQPVVSGANDVPSDVYECAWDGETLAVGWEQDSQGMPLSGGHVAIDVLSDVLAKMGDSLYVQACSPGCHNQFVHQTIAVVTADSDSQATIRLRDGQIEAAVKGGELDAAVWFVHNACGGAINAFAEAKGIYQRISDLELLARQNLDHLLGHYVEHAELAARPLRNTVRSRWRQRRWRREAQVLMANIFIALSAIETLKTQWADSRRTLRDAEAVALVEPDLRGDDHAIDKLDLSQVASATEHLATRIDNRAEVLATSVGALGGAVSGAAVSGVFALLQ
jgi:hypothetical protein